MSGDLGDAKSCLPRQNVLPEISGVKNNFT